MDEKNRPTVNPSIVMEHTFNNVQVYRTSRTYAAIVTKKIVKPLCEIDQLEAQHTVTNI